MLIPIMIWRSIVSPHSDEEVEDRAAPSAHGGEVLAVLALAAAPSSSARSRSTLLNYIASMRSSPSASCC